MAEQGRMTITGNQAREEIGTTVRGSGNALLIVGGLSLIYGLVAPEPDMGSGLHTGISAIFGAATIAGGGAMRYIGGLIMDRKSLQP